MMKVRKSKKLKILLFLLFLITLIVALFHREIFFFFMKIFNNKNEDILKYLKYGKFGYDDYYVREIKDYDEYIKSSKLQNRTLIFVIGDSFTYGTGISFNSTYAANLERILNGKLNKKVTVVNLGVEGYNAEYEFKRLSYFLKYNPDIVIWQYLNNDMEPTYISAFIFANKDAIQRKGIYFYYYLAQSYMSTKFEKQLYLIYYKKYFLELETISKEKNMKIILFDYNNTKIDFRILDISYFDNNLSFNNFLLPDEKFHPNEEYNAILAESISSYLMKSVFENYTLNSIE